MAIDEMANRGGTMVVGFHDDDAQGRAARRRALDEAVAGLYAAFAGRRLSPGGPDACTECCASPEAMARIAGSAQDAVAFDDLQEYHSAAKGEGAGQDLAFLLPRTMAFLAQGRTPKHVGAFALFSTYFPPVWPTLEESERAAIGRYGAALMLWRLGAGDDGCDFFPSCILEMILTGGFDFGPVMDALADPPPTVEAVKKVVHLISYETALWLGECADLAPDMPAERVAAFAEALRGALSSPGVVSLLEAAMSSEDDAELAEEAAQAYDLTKTMDDGPDDPVARWWHGVQTGQSTLSDRPERWKTAMLIYKICDTALRARIEAEGRLDGAPVDLADGFIHFSTAGQVAETAAKHFAGQGDLVLMAVEPDALGEALKWEPSRGGALFPHLYRPLDASEILWTRPMPLGEDGKHEIPL